MKSSIQRVAARYLGDRLPGGLADNKKPEDFDQTELAKGTQEEMEHVDDPSLAQEIAMDHLMENSKYYTMLQKMEDLIESVKRH